jgi:hypothetical protein
MRRRRTLVYVLLALAVPLPAFALTSGGAPAAPSLSVSASLASCGVAGDQVVCQIDASWNAVAGATRYTATVTKPDGSVVDFGEVGSGGQTFNVGYAGNGTYTVTVSVYGTPPEAEEPEVIAKDSSGAGGDKPAADAASGQEPPAEEPADTDEVTDPGQQPEEPACEPAPAPEQPPETTEETTATTAESSTTTTSTTTTTTTTTPTETCP